MLAAWTFLHVLSSVDPSQTDPRGAVWSGSTLLVVYAVGCSRWLYAYANTMNYFLRAYWAVWALIRLIIEEQPDMTLHFLLYVGFEEPAVRLQVYV